MSQRPPLTLIVGMHRSGTSLLGSILPACGIATPGPLIAGDTHNPEGYFERADITALQEQLLIDLERWWPAPEGCEPLPPGWMQSDVSQHALEQLTALLADDCASQSGPWAIKDPRSSLLLPLWKSACTALNIPLNLLLAVRDPAEVSVSLTRRDQTLTGMSHWRAQRLWWHHNVNVLRNGHGLPLEVVSYSNWFDPKRACTQLERLAPHCSEATRRNALEAIRPEHRRSLMAAQAFECAPSIHRLYAHLNALASRSANAPLESSLQQLMHWLKQQNEPTEEPPLGLKATVKEQIKQLIGRQPPSSDHQHPWYPLAVLVCGDAGAAADHQLNHWIDHGFAPDELTRIQNLPTAAPTAEPWVAPPGERQVNVRLSSPLADHWGHHAWLDLCPIVADQHALALAALGEDTASPVALNFWEPQAGFADAQTLLALAALERVWDPCKERVQLLRRFGIRASWLQPQPAGNGHLRSRHNGDPLGLPEPKVLRSIGCKAMCLGSMDPALNQGLEPPLAGVHSFDTLASRSNTHQVAQWLRCCLDADLAIVRFEVSAFEQRNQTWQALVNANHPAPAVLFPQAPIGAGDILHELTWQRQKDANQTPCVTPTPEARCVAHHEARQPDFAVCISLYNYADTIRSALNSAASQSIVDRLELIVVDDRSTDDSLAVAHQWLKTNEHRFARCLLLQHTENGGLAAARNTAFQAAKSSWCFVLDADNRLHAKAVEHCGALTTSADPRCGVIYPLINVLNQHGSQDPRPLVSDRPWDPSLLAEANYIDAMALVRVEAWRQVGGYTHIPGGWEDYDFWCKLVDAEWHGLHCPQVLATYTSHLQSMRATSTNRQERQLRRLLQQRHPWLRLLTQEDGVVWPPATQTSASSARAKPAKS